MALAPRLALLGEPSRSIRCRSMPRWSSPSKPSRASRIGPLTLSTAPSTLLPPNASPPSRSSTASNWPVDAPEGTMARPVAPEARNTSTSTVGLPRESRTWRPSTCSMLLIGRCCSCCRCGGWYCWGTARRQHPSDPQLFRVGSGSAHTGCTRRGGHHLRHLGRLLPARHRDPSVGGGTDVHVAHAPRTDKTHGRVYPARPQRVSPGSRCHAP